MNEPINNEAIKERLKELKRKKLELLKQQAAYQQDNLIEFFNNPERPLMDGSFLKPNLKQALLLEAFKNPKYRLYTYTGANRCLGGETKIYDPVKNAYLTVSEIDTDFHVMAWNGKGLVPAKAHKPFVRGHGDIYRLSLSSGRSLSCTASHKVLTTQGFRKVSELQVGSQVCTPHDSDTLPSRPFSYFRQQYTYSHQVYLKPEVLGNQVLCNDKEGLHPSACVNLGNRHQPTTGDFSANSRGFFPSNSYTYPCAQNLYEKRSTQIGVDSLGGCHLCCHLYDGLPRLGQENGLFSSPSQDGAQTHTQFAWRMGALEYGCKCIPYSTFCHPSNRCSCVRLGVSSALMEPRVPLESSVGCLHPGRVSLPIVCGYQAKKENLVFDLPSDILPSYETSTVENIEFVRRDYYYDFTVPIYHNYQDESRVISANCGKTTIWAIIAICCLAGKWLWSGEPIRFSHNKPRKLRVIGQGWSSHIKTVVVPELWKWWPKNRPIVGGKPKKNNDGVEYFWEDALTGSTLEIMSNRQESEMFEGWSGDGLFFDEPPDRNVRVAAARGLIDRGGFELYACTLLKEAWVAQDIIKARLPDGRPDPSVYNVHATIEDNIGYGITRENVDQFAKMLTEDEKDARLRGVPSYMSGLVYPQFARDIHLKKRFRVPLDWPVDIAIDTHPRKPHSVLFMATSPRGFKYCIHEIREHGDGKSIAESVVRLVQWGVYRVNKVIIDPLSKGDSNETDTTFEKASDVFARHGMYLETASKNKDAGILSVKEYLKSENNEASLFFFDDLVYTIKEIEGLMWEVDPNSEKEKAQKVDDDMMENLYRLILLGTEYTRAVEAEEDEVPVVSGVNKVTGY